MKKQLKPWLTAFLGALLMMTLGVAEAAEAVDATLYKNPSCRCCDAYAVYLRQHDFDVIVIASPHLEHIKREHAVPPPLHGCHTLLVEGYVVEGHVPVEVINKLLRERPEIRGVSLPGMPPGSPGMTGRKQEPFVIYSITDDETSVYATD